MVVVSDTSALTSLLSIRQISILKNLFGNVFIPKAVCNELLRFHKRIPSFVKTEQIHDLESVTALTPTLDIGEAEAIVLAKELRADFLLVDENLQDQLRNAKGFI